MPAIKWDQIGEKIYETGVKNGVLYPQAGGAYPKGVAWNGLTTISESPTGAEATALYADDIKYLNLLSAEELEGTIEAYTYPDEFAECDGSAEVATGVMIGQQNRKTFGLAYTTTVGNDTESNNYGYKLHLIYGCLASPSERSYATINDSPEAITFSWSFKTTPVSVGNFKPTANIVINSTKANESKLADLKKVLFGFDVAEFSIEKTYQVGDYAMYNDVSYRCKEAIDVTGAWDESKWEEDATAGVARLPLPDEIVSIMGDDLG